MVDINKLLQSSLDTLILSIDGITQETYSKYRRGGDFNKVMNNLKEIIRRKKLFKKKNPKIIWQFLCMRHNEHEIPGLKKLTKRLGIKLDIKPVRLDTAVDKEIAENSRLNKKAWLPLDIKLIRKEYKTNKRTDIPVEHADYTGVFHTRLVQFRIISTVVIFQSLCKKATTLRMFEIRFTPYCVSSRATCFIIR